MIHDSLAVTSDEGLQGLCKRGYISPIICLWQLRCNYSGMVYVTPHQTINVYDKQKRHQVMNDLKVYLSDIFSKGKTNMDEEMMRYLVQLYGAYFDEGSVKIILELMDVGSLRDILNMVKQIKSGPPYIEEPYLANIAYQVYDQRVLYVSHHFYKGVERTKLPARQKASDSSRYQAG